MCRTVLSHTKPVAPLTVSALYTKTDTFANSLDPGETTHNMASYLDLHCLSFCLWITTVTLIAAMDVSKCRDEG